MAVFKIKMTRQYYRRGKLRQCITLMLCTALCISTAKRNTTRVQAKKMKEAFNKAINKLMGIKKHYYVIFALLIIFSAYNTITLRGFFYAENAPLTFFGFMDRYNGYTNAVSRSFLEADSGKGLVPSPENIHDVENAREWYGSILGTIVLIRLPTHKYNKPQLKENR